MKRRLLLLSTPVGFGALLALKTALSQPNAKPQRIRENITKFSTNSQKVSSLRSAVRIMKSRPVTDRSSWRFWAAVHQYPLNSNDLNRQRLPKDFEAELQADQLWAAPEDIKSAWYKCSHSFDPVPEAGIHFLSWHRIYLFFFESVLREASPSKDLSLPYWDQVAEPKLPLIFREKNNNPLFTPLRDRRVNDGFNVSGLNYSALGATDLFNAPVQVDEIQFRGFSQGIEHNTHNVGHGAVSGLMAHPYTAALDPIFWLHHANVDRLWSIWLKRYPAKSDPSIIANWLTKQFSFYDLGKLTDVQVERFLDIGIGYRYDDESFPAFDVAPTPPARLPKKTVTGKRLNSSGQMREARYGKFTLGNDGISIKLPLGQNDKRDLQNVARAQNMDGNTSKLLLVLTGVHLGKNALQYGFKFDVYLHLPASSPNGELVPQRHRVGSFGPFELACNSPACGPQGRVLKFELNSSIQNQLANNTTLPDNAYVSFVREGARDDAKVLLPIPEDAQLIEITSLSLEKSK